jgi:hypothetical protein
MVCKQEIGKMREKRRWGEVRRKIGNIRKIGKLKL